MKYSNGDQYDGQWLKDEIKGKGSIIYKDGTILEG